ncbi:hypothetical protein OAS39_13810, partial [Pirellulales bacterium]|nr:hypothetical protein [Pirellulales bacterium]
MPSRRRGLLALAALVWLAMPAVGGWFWGADELEDWFLKNAMPVGVVWNLLIIAAVVFFWQARPRPAAAALVLALLLWLVGNPALGHRLFAWHESLAAAAEGDPFLQSFDAIAVLGGCSRRLPG